MHLRAFGPGVWIADGPPVTVVWPLRLPTRMVAVRLGDGSLWINSPIDVSPQAMDEVAKLGPVAHLVSPTKLHTWRLAAWKQHFPGARCWAPPDILRDEPPPDWSADLDQVVMRGNAFLDETEFLHPSSRTVIFCDFIQNYRLFRGVPPDARWTYVKKELARQSLRKLFSWDFDNLIVAHGDCVTGGAKEFVASAFRFLLRA
ncbi:MAG TPA: DUF4336 domain-containing protein [Candidatus Acidoferrales bacterium]|nr:DUF4336 domain-containing protein [Candidatus Acidoferrales bacterium]